MNAILEVLFNGNVTMAATLTNTDFTEWPGVYTIHADSGFNLTIYKKDLINYVSDEKTDVFTLQVQGCPITIKLEWDCVEGDETA